MLIIIRLTLTKLLANSLTRILLQKLTPTRLFNQLTSLYVDRDSAVGIVTRYGLDGPGIESRWGGEIFRTRPDRPWGTPSLLYNRYRGFPGGKAPGEWFWPPTSSDTEVKERVELYLCSPSGPSSSVIGWTLPLPLLHRPLQTLTFQCRVLKSLETFLIIKLVHLVSYL